MCSITARSPAFVEQIVVMAATSFKAAKTLARQLDQLQGWSWSARQRSMQQEPSRGISTSVNLRPTKHSGNWSWKESTRISPNSKVSLTKPKVVTQHCKQARHAIACCSLAQSCRSTHEPMTQAGTNAMLQMLLIVMQHMLMAVQSKITRLAVAMPFNS